MTDADDGLEGQAHPHPRDDLPVVAHDEAPGTVDAHLAEPGATQELGMAQEELLAHQARIEALVRRRVAPTAWRQRLFDSLPVPALLTDTEGRVLALNAPARALLGVRGDEVLLALLSDVVRGQDGPVVLSVLADTVRSGTGRAGLVVLTPTGQVRITAVAGLVGPVAGHEPDATQPAADAVTWVLGPDRADDRARGRRALATAEAFTEMSRLPLTSDADPRTILARAALLIERAVPGSDGVSITLGSPADPELQATDNEFAQLVDVAQRRARQGPCLQAYRSGRVQLCEDLGADPRWPTFALLAAPTGVATVLAVPVRQENRSLGVLSLYARRPEAFDLTDRVVADQLVTAVKAVVQEVGDRHELTATAEQLREALSSRAVIDQAKGILMARGGYDADQALAQLVAAARRTNIKLRALARLVVDDAADPLRDTT